MFTGDEAVAKYRDLQSQLKRAKLIQPATCADYTVASRDRSCWKVLADLEGLSEVRLKSLDRGIDRLETALNNLN